MNFHINHLLQTYDEGKVYPFYKEGRSLERLTDFYKASPLPVTSEAWLEFRSRLLVPVIDYDTACHKKRSHLMCFENRFGASEISKMEFYGSK